MLAAGNSSMLRISRTGRALYLAGVRHRIPQYASVDCTNAIKMTNTLGNLTCSERPFTSTIFCLQAEATAALADNAEEAQEVELPEEAQAVSQEKLEAAREMIGQRHRDLIAQLNTDKANSDSSDSSIPDPSGGVQIRDKLRTAINALQEGLVERDIEVRLLLLAAMAGENILLIGPPGTGKSEVGRRLSKLVQGSYFERLLTKFSVPEELFGPLSMHALEQDKYVRQTHGYLPEAEVAFIDEIFKANSSILNTLLTLFNEKLFDNGSHRVPVPLLTAVAASNELPETEELDALFDRFLIRRQVQQVSDSGMSDLLMLSSKRKQQNGSSVSGTAMGTISQESQLSQEDIRKCREQALEEVEVTHDVIDMVIDLRTYMQTKLDPPAYISDRRMVKAIQLLQVAAFCNGRNAVSLYDCMLLQHVLWQQPQQAAKIADWVTETLKQNDGMKQAKFILSGIMKRAETVQNAGTPRKVAGLVADITALEDTLKAKYRELLEVMDGGSLSRDNLWLGSDDADALATALAPQLESTKRQTEALLGDVIRLQVALAEGIDVQLLAAVQPDPQQQQGAIAGQTIAFSGFRDANWESRIVALGGGISRTSVTRSTTMLVVHNQHAAPTKKVEAAKQYGIKIVNKYDFSLMLDAAEKAV